jgi:serine/threonine protein kinase
MLEPKASRFYQAALQSGLIDEAGLVECFAQIPLEKQTPDAIDRRLARATISSGRLTLWQAQQILGGRSSGFKIDKYVLLDLLGRGGMGRVYLARDLRLNRLVALKVLSQERMNNPRAIARFQREAKVGAQLQHENLVRVYDTPDSRI